MSFKGVLVKNLKKQKGKYCYRGRLWELNKPVKSTSKTKKMMVLATKVIHGKQCVKIIHFGGKGYRHNYSEIARKNYLKRSEKITNKEGCLTKNDRWSANHWSRKTLWCNPKRGTKTMKKAA